MTPARIVVSGASRGIGEALARGYAAPGIELALLGRDADRLQRIADECRALGAAAEVVEGDVRDRVKLAAQLRALDEARPVDLVIANAGIALAGSQEPGEDLTVYPEIDVNVLGALNTVLPLLPAMTARGRGQVAFVSSLAAYAPLPSSPGYSASKAALLVYGLALRERLRPAGIAVSVICPGYIDTEMGGRYRGWRPLAMTADQAAMRIRRGLAADRPVIAFPRRLALLARASQFVPEAVRRAGLRAFRFTISDTA